MTLMAMKVANASICPVWSMVSASLEKVENVVKLPAPTANMFLMISMRI